MLKARTSEGHTPWERTLRYDIAMFGFFLTAIAAGWILKAAVTGQRTMFTNDETRLSLEYPSTWVLFPDKESLLSIQDIRAEGPLKTAFKVEVRDRRPQEPGSIQAIIAPFTAGRGRILSGYQVTNVAEARVGNLDGIAITYAYVDPPSLIGGRAGLPVVVKAVDVLVPFDNRLYIFTLIADADVFQGQLPSLETILNSVAFGE